MATWRFWDDQLNSRQLFRFGITTRNLRLAQTALEGRRKKKRPVKNTTQTQGKLS